jgi:hypothetical protein
MLGKHRLKPSFLFEVAFLVGVWLIAWRVFNPPLAVLVFIIFTAYALVFLYENWLDSLSRRERADARRSQRKKSEPHREFEDPSRKSQPSAGVQKPSKAEPVAAAHSISERLTAKLHGRETEEKTPAPPAAVAPVAPPEPVSSAVSGSFERPAGQVEQKDTPRPEPQSMPRKREEHVPSPAAEDTPRSVSEAANAPRSEPAPEERRVGEPEKSHSLMAEIAAGPDARKAGPVGGWNVWQLERLLAAQAKPDPERDYERSMMLVYLREFADSDGQLPPQFDDLVRESFADLVRGPAS